MPSVQYRGYHWQLKKGEQAPTPRRLMTSNWMGALVATPSGRTQGSLSTSCAVMRLRMHIEADAQEDRVHMVTVCT